MKPRVRRWLWGGLIALFALGLAAAYRQVVLLSPTPTLSWVRGTITYELLAPRMLGLLLVAPLLLWVMGRSLADLPWQQRVLSILLRMAFLTLLAVGLARPARTAFSDKICGIYLVDVSDSVPDQALRRAQKVLQQGIEGKRNDDIIRLVTFAKRPRLIDLAPNDSTAPEIKRHDTPGAKTHLGAATNLQSALQHAYGLFPSGYLKRAVLLSDGLQTDGNVLAEASRAKQFGVKLFSVPQREPPPAEVAIQQLTVPERVKVGETFEVRASVYATRPTTAKAKLYQGDMLNGLDAVRELQLVAGPNPVAFRSVVRVAGAVTYKMQLDELAEDRFADNNHYTTTVQVPGRPTVLYVEGDTPRATYLANALTAQQFDIDVRSPSAFPVSLQELERFDFVILSDTPAEKISIASQQLVQQYVQGLGGGFLFVGGPAGFGLGGWSNTTIEKLLPVRMDTEHRRDTPSLAMALVIDRSGSMSGLPLEMAKAAARATLDVLSPSDLVMVIAFDSSPTRYVRMQPARNRGSIGYDISRIQAGGGTEIFSALDGAYQDLTLTNARKKHVILLTDGQSPNRGIADLVQAMIAESITVTTVGLGNSTDDTLLQQIADAGQGRYHKVLDPNSLPRIFTRETEMVTRQAAVEEWFPVTVVSSADFLNGIDIGAAPFLHGYVATRLKPPPAQLILQSDTGEPILARWRAGSGWAIAWTSDVKNLWAVEWLRWPGYGQFWGQLVREHMRTKHRRELDMQAQVKDGRVHAVVDAFDADNTFDNGLDSTLSVTGPEPKGQSYSAPLRQTAPGRYEAWVDLPAYGSYLLEAKHHRWDDKGQSKQVAVSYGHVSNPYPREYASFEPDLPTLEQTAAVTGGSEDPTPSQVFSPDNEKIAFHEPLWNRLVFPAIFVFLIDLFVRRVRVFDRKFLPRRRKETASA